MKNFGLRISIYAVVLGVAWSFIWSQLLADYGFLLLILIGISWYLYPYNIRHLAIANKIWTAVTIIYLAYFIVESLSPYHSLMKSLQHLIIFILFFKLCNLINAKDGYQIALISFVALISAFSWNFEAFMIYPFLFTSLFIIVALLQISAYSGTMESSKVSSAIKPSRVIIHGVTALSIIALSGMLLFFLVPRKSFAYFNNLQLLKREYLTGFSSEVKLGDIGNIMMNKEVAFRVKLNKKMDEKSLYWRGVAFDSFDKKEWHNTTADRVVGNPLNIIYLGQRANEYIIQKIYSTYLANRFLFHLYPVAAVRINRSHLIVDGNENLMNISSNYQIYTYPADALPVAKITASQIEKYFQLPRLDQRIIDLALSITGKSNSSLKKAYEIKDYLLQNYEYTLSPEDYGSEDPVTDFLLYRKKGHCEYFASAMCVMLRINKIPCRLVNGFLGGEYNLIGDYYIVRQSNAHSWVEAYFPGKGWVLLDATPAASPEPISIRLGRWLSTINDSVTFLWENYILLYSAVDQAVLFQFLNQLFVSLWDYISRLLGVTLSGFPMHMIIIGLSFILIVFIIIKLMHKISQRSFANSAQARFYLLFLIKMRFLGYRKKDNMTPYEFMEYVKHSHFAKDAENITLRYCKIKYGR